jgi:hypothetical protein
LENKRQSKGVKTLIKRVGQDLEAERLTVEKEAAF